MASRRTKLASATLLLAAATGYGLYMATAQTAPPELAQAPLNVSSMVPPAFIMAVDDSRSMAYQSVFPTTESPGSGGGGAACWSGNSDTATDSSWSFFSGPGQLRLGRVGGRGTCAYFYFTTGVRDLNNNGIPPIDAYGFARSPAYSPTAYDPTVVYTPWAKGDGTHYPNSTPTAAKLHPHGTDAVNLTGLLFDKNNRSLFYAHTGMRLPAGMKYRLSATCNNSGLPVRNTNNDGTIPAGGVTMTASCNMYIEHRPATFYMTTSAIPQLPGSPNAYAGITPVEVANACGTGCSLWRFEIPAANTAAMQNFANWFTYYGNRQRASIAAASHALAEVNNMRIGYFTINNRTPVTMYDMDNATQKAQLYGSDTATPGSTTLLGLLANGSATPNISAVDFMGQQFQRTNDGKPIVSACQKNAGMLFTDGFNNGSSEPNASAITGLGVPFDPTPVNSMAAIASKYYFNSNANTVGTPGTSPLVGSFDAGKVPVPDECKTVDRTSLAWKRMDCQSNLHMNFYAITMGARGARFNPDANPRQDPFVAPHISWPAAKPGNDTADTVDDLWHATVNTRGEFINANSSGEITAAMRRILASVNAGRSPSGTIAVTGARVGTGSLSVTPSYDVRNNGTDWSSELTGEIVSSNPVTGAVTYTPAWEASARIAAQGAGGRTIRFGTTGSSVVPTVRDFTAANVSLAALCTAGRCTATELTALASGMNNTRAVAYLRGDRSDEGALRTRRTLLGDIINSTPVLASPNDDYGYGAMAGTLGTSYKTYLTAKKTRTPLVVVGANDGMLHVFNGSSDSPPGGNEVFAYIPATAVGHLGNMLYPYKAADRDDQKFRHRYLVDGPVVVSDVYNGSAWKTVAVGTAGAGGRSVFALDITNPASPTVLWEINNLITGNAAISGNIGHVLGKPVIVPVRTAAGAVSWKVVFGNGYNSTNQQARLFVVDAWTGAATSIAAAESPAPTSYNGLGNVVAIDAQRRNADDTAWTAGRDGFADTVYAADQNGAVWKFDLLGNSVALDGVPLFVAKDSAGNRQSITGGLTVAAGASGGVMIYFGTGSFAFSGDQLRNSVQTIYGVPDKGVAVSGRSQLQQQTVGADAGGFRATSSNNLASGKVGWYLDLPAGERFVGYPRIESGIVFFPTYEPSENAGADDCSVSGTNWLYGLNALSGGAALTNVRMGSPTGPQPSSATGAVALNTGGSAPVKDVAVMTTPRVGPLAPGASQADIDAALAAQCSMVVRVAGAPAMYLPRPCGRQSWRQVR